MLIRAATRAPSPGNSQGWDFVVVRDRDTKARLGKEMGATRRAMRSAVDPEPTPAARGWPPVRIGFWKRWLTFPS